MSKYKKYGRVPVIEITQDMKTLMTTDPCLECGQRCKPGFTVCDDCYRRDWGTQDE